MRLGGMFPSPSSKSARVPSAKGGGRVTVAIGDAFRGMMWLNSPEGVAYGHRHPSSAFGRRHSGGLARWSGKHPPNRIRMTPLPGSATEEDVLEVERRTGLAAEPIDGVLVEKPPGFIESLLAAALGTHLCKFVLPGKLGIVLGEGGRCGSCPARSASPTCALSAGSVFRGANCPRWPFPPLPPIWPSRFSRREYGRRDAAEAARLLCGRRAVTW